MLKSELDRVKISDHHRLIIGWIGPPVFSCVCVYLTVHAAIPTPTHAYLYLHHEHKLVFAKCIKVYIIPVA